MSQEVYELGKICQELAEEKGIELKPIDIPSKTPSLKDFGNCVFSKQGIMEWDLRAKTLDNPVALEGTNENYYFLYAGSQTQKPEQITSEALYIETNQRIISVTRGIKGVSAHIKVKDKKAQEVFKDFNAATPYLFEEKISFYDSNEFPELSQIKNIKKALEQLL